MGVVSAGSFHFEKPENCRFKTDVNMLFSFVGTSANILSHSKEFHITATFKTIEV